MTITATVGTVVEGGLTATVGVPLPVGLTWLQSCPEPPFRWVAVPGNPADRLPLAEDPGTEPGVLHVLLHDHVPSVAACAAVNPATPGLACAGGHDDPTVAACAAGNPSVPWPDVERLVDGADGVWSGVAAAALRRPDCPPAFVDRMCVSSEARVRACAATVTRSAERLADLACDREYRVRFAVAGNSACPLHVLDVLAGDRQPAVRVSVAMNPAAGRDALLRLAAVGGHPAVVSAAAARHELGWQDVAALADDEDTAVRAALAGRPDVPEDVQHRLASGGDLSVCETLAENPAAAPDVLGVLAGHPDPDVRAAVARNPAASDAARAVAVLSL